MNDQIDANDWLLASGVPSATFKTIGDHVVGFILRAPEMQQQRDFTTSEPLYWPGDNKPKLQMKVVLMTEEQDPEDPDDSGERAIYIRGQMHKAVSDAVRKAGAPGLEIGGKLLVRYIGDGKASQRGLNPPKLYEARYKRPEGSDTAQPEPATSKPADLDAVPF